MAREPAPVAGTELAMWHWDIQRDIVTGDGAMRFLFDIGADVEEGPVELFFAAMHPDDLVQARADIAHALRTGAPYESRLRTRARDGRWHTIVSRGEAQFDASGKPVALRGALHDVTPAHQAQRALDIREERYRTLFEATDQAVCIIEMIYDAAGQPVDYRFLETNRAFALHTGLDDAVGKTVLQLVPGHDIVWMQLYGKVARTGVPVRYEDQVAVMERWFDVSATRVGGDGSRIVAVLFTDITERKRSQFEQQRLAADLTEANRRKNEFLATLAHELRNPLAPLRSGLPVLRLTEDPAVRARVLDVMERQLSHMVGLVDDLLDVARITHGKVELKPARIDLRTVLQAAIDASLPLLDERGHSFSAQIGSEAMPLEGDSNRLIQVFNNLLNNAAKYTPRGGIVTLVAEREQDGLLVAIHDNGNGIEPDLLEEVFELFNQVGQGRNTAEGGLGIGLSLVRNLVELHGGTVVAASPGAGQGSTFSVRLPCVDVPAPQAADPVGILPAAGVKVLVVDDNIDAAMMLAEVLELFGHSVRVVHDGGAALAAIALFSPRVVFLDLGMPGMDGYAVAEAIRADKAFKQPLLAALTGWDTPNDRARTRAAGFDVHLTKPVDLSNIQQILAGLND